MAKRRTSSATKDKYNEYSYARYTIRIRKDTMLHDEVEDFMSKNGMSLNYLVSKLLKNENQTSHNITDKE